MFNPSLASKEIRNEFINYITTSYYISDSILREQFESKIRKLLTKGPIIEINGSFEKGSTLRDLINERVLCQSFSEIESRKSGEGLYDIKLPLDRNLYLHQEQAIRKCVSGQNLVVSTGTGSGKTETFLIPILNELLKEKESGTLGPGVRAILIYPMNALANDQLKRIREILLKFESITFGVYNGATEHNEEQAQKLYEAMYEDEMIPELRKRLQNEVISREDLQQNPPHILFTNYAMLEHMLLRPNDAKVFNNSNFKYIILDEAHVYYGSTGMETAMLIRRLKARIPTAKRPQFILTSATLGSDKEKDDKIVSFAKNLTGESFDLDSVIRASRKAYEKPNDLIEYPEDLFNRLVSDIESTTHVLSEYGISKSKNEDNSEFFYDICEKSSIYHSIREVLLEPLSISQVSRLTNYNEKTIIDVIQIASSAFKNGASLVNARFHFFLRALEGTYLQLYPRFDLDVVRKSTELVDESLVPVFETASCSDCGKIALIGIESNTDRTIERNIPYYSDKLTYFYVNTDQNEYLIDDEELEEVSDLSYVLCKKCGSFMASDETDSPPCSCIKNHGIKVTKSINGKCPSCGLGKFKRFYLGNDAATAVIGLSLYDQLPEYSYIEPEIVQDSENNPFSVFSESSFKKRLRKTRQFLVFSDSRQEAAYFASYMSASYKQFIRRRGLFKVLSTVEFDRIEIGNAINELTALFSSPENQSFITAHNSIENISFISKRNAWIVMLDEMANQQRSTSLASLGYIHFEYKGNDQEAILINLSKKYSVPLTDIKNLLNVVFNEFIKFGAIDTAKNNSLLPEDRELIFYYPKQKYLVKNKNDGSIYESCYNVLPQRRGNGNFFKTNRIELIKSTLNIEDEEATKLLDNYWEYLISTRNNYKLNTNDGIHYTINPDSIVLVSSFHKNNKIYKCDKCSRLTPFNLGDKCVSIKCDGELFEIDIELENNRNHFVNLYKRENLSPFFIKEHTAQLSRRESLDYQKKFVQKELNALSCSTTFEMGVDVGSLETVFLRNMPPLPSNYSQRAGRAGRSKNAAAFAVTYSKLSSHDFNFYKEPNRMIKGVISPPVFKIDNEKILQRHVNAIVLSYFFQLHPEQYNGNKIENFLDNKGYQLLEKMLMDKPSKLKEIVRDSIPSFLHQKIELEDFGFSNYVLSEEAPLQLAIIDYEKTVQQFEKYIKIAKKDDKFYDASYYQIGLKKFKRKRLIDFLAKGNVLPRYGFPVDTVELQTYSTSKNNDSESLNLSRDLQIAISEYAPGSQIVANDQLFTSRYIKKTFTRNDHIWQEGFIAVCENDTCRAVNFEKIKPYGEENYCRSCGTKLRRKMWRNSIEPSAGFIADKVVTDVPLSKPEKLYRTEEYYIGSMYSKPIKQREIWFGENSISLKTTQNDSLLVKTQSDFYVCSSCGYALNENEINTDYLQKAVYRDEKGHDTPTGHKCRNLDLKLFTLHHIFNTDVCELTFSIQVEGVDQGLSILSALLDSISLVLDVERSDLKGTLRSLVSKEHEKEYSFIIYDAVAGGVGHTQRLIDENENEGGELISRIFRNAHEKTKNCVCEPSCYSCLRNYGNQRIHERLNRNSVFNYLEHYILPITETKTSEYDVKDALIEQFELVINTELFSKDILDWNELMNFSSESNLEIFEDMFKKGFRFPDHCIGDIMINDSFKVSVDALWEEEKILVFNDTDGSKFNKLKVYKDWKIISNYSQYIEELYNGKDLSE